LESMQRKLEGNRLLSIVGPPGIGKTSVALRLAETLLTEFSHGVWLVDLSSVASPSLIPSALASALPVDIRSSDTLS
ncbi:AAA family ATPase, partial [Acinetobacter baumannii]